MDPRLEAFERLGGRYDARVLEPAPPAVSEGPWFADDPVNEPGPGAGLPVVSPVAGELRWETLAAGDADLSAWAAERGLGPLPPLEPLPAGFAANRLAAHLLADTVVARTRERVNGKFGLRWTRGGFGTPFFGDDVQVRVEGVDLVVGERRAPVTSRAAALDLLGPEIAPDGDGPELRVLDPASMGALAAWFRFGAHVLETLRAEAGPAAEPSRVQLWPEHFDIAVELGSETAGRRAAYGLSPGDESHDEPYVYVAPWTARPEGELWNARGFPGAELGYTELLAARDQRAAALGFLRARAAGL